MLWYQQTSPDPQIIFQTTLEYPRATMTRAAGERVQIIPVEGAWTPVMLEFDSYRLLKPDEVTLEIQAVVEWCYAETLGIGGVPADVLGIEGQSDAP
jgi:hypothetical protein